MKRRETLNVAWEESMPDVRVYDTRMELTPEIASRVAGFIGVAQAVSSRYRLTVAKGFCHQWAEIHPLIMAALEPVSEAPHA